MPESKIIFSNDKGLYATENSFLIDDREKNIKSFRDNGGKSIEFFGNETPVKKVIEEIENIQIEDKENGDNKEVESNTTTTFSGHKTAGKKEWNGLTLTIENPKGSVRKGIDPDGTPWETKMVYDYGYINKTDSMEIGGDHLDYFQGPYKYAKKVYVIKIQDPETKIPEEDKCFLDFKTKGLAVKAFQQSYDEKWKQRINKIKTLPVKEFKEKILNKLIDL